MKKLVPAALLLLIGVVAVWMSRRPMSVGEEAKHFPANEGIVLSIDGEVVRRIAGKPGKEEADFAEFARGTGFDYRRDLDRLVAAIGGERNYFLVTGNFDWERIYKYAESLGGRCVDRVCRVAASQPGKWISFLPLRTNVLALAVAADPAEVQSMKQARARASIEIGEGPLWVRVPGKTLEAMARADKSYSVIAGALGEIDVVEARLVREAIEASLLLADEKKALEVETALYGKVGDLKREGRRIVLRWKLDEGLLGKVMAETDR